MRFLSSETLFDYSKCLDVPSTPTPNVSEANGTVAQKQMAKFTKSFRNSGGKGAWCTFSKPGWSALPLGAVKALGSDASTDQRSGKATKRPGCREVGTSTRNKKSWISRIGFWLRHLFLLADLYHLNCTSGGRLVQWFHDVPCMFGHVNWVRSRLAKLEGQTTGMLPVANLRAMWGSHKVRPLEPPPRCRGHSPGSRADCRSQGSSSACKHIASVCTKAMVMEELDMPNLTSKTEKGENPKTPPKRTPKRTQLWTQSCGFFFSWLGGFPSCKPWIFKHMPCTSLTKHSIVRLTTWI